MAVLGADGMAPAACDRDDGSQGASSISLTQLSDAVRRWRRRLMSLATAVFQLAVLGVIGALVIKLAPPPAAA